MADFELPKLPFAFDALAPAMSKETLEYHYGKHNKAYVDNLNALVKGSRFEGLSLKQIVKEANGPLFNNAAQAFNHAYFWCCLSPQGGGKPDGDLLAAIERKWGSYEAFVEAFRKEALGNFGSGWTWLVRKAGGALDIVNTGNAGTPAQEDLVKPILCLDLWEHAYYVDYRNDRGSFIDAFFDKLVNWEFGKYRYNGGPFEYGNL